MLRFRPFGRCFRAPKQHSHIHGPRLAGSHAVHLTLMLLLSLFLFLLTSGLAPLPKEDIPSDNSPSDISQGVLHAESLAPPGQTSVNQQSVPSDKRLAQDSDLIIHGMLTEGQQSYPTSASVGNRRVVHYLQQIKVLDTWKGASRRAVSLLTSGVEPLPDGPDPLNSLYTGPITEGEYVFFLRRAPQSDYYTLTGLWQGLYPVMNGKSVALLASGGFSSFDQLPISRFKLRVLALVAPP